MTAVAPTMHLPIAPGGDGQGVGERPPLVSPVLAEWITWWMTGLDDDARSELSRYGTRFHRSPGTPAQEERRRWMVADWFVRTYAPRWLHEAEVHPWADALEQLQPLSHPEDVAVAQEEARRGLRAVRLRRQALQECVRSRADRPSAAPQRASNPWTLVVGPVDAAAASAASPLAEAARRAAGVWLPVVTAAVVDACASVVWNALAECPPGDVWARTSTIARHALAAPTNELHAAAHQLIDQLLAVTDEAPEPA